MTAIFAMVKMAMIILPFIGSLVICELCFNLMYKKLSWFRRWFDDLCKSIGVEDEYV